MCQSDMALHHTEKVLWYLNTLFVNVAEQIKINCKYEAKLQTHNVAHNLNRNLWVISALATKKLQIQCLQKVYHISVKTSFQLVFLPNACEACCRNMYIPTTLELTKNDPTLTLHK